jgi:MoaA/NifB/PqqE/SkfB family radical SAM enzyme
MHELSEFAPVVRKLRPLSVILTGGEPLVRQDLTKLVSEIKKERPLIISLLTNGSLLTEDKARRLLDAGLDTISVSLNHIGEAQDREKRIPGLFDHVSRLLPRLAIMGFKRVNVNTVFLDNNLEEIPEIIGRARDWGVGVSFSCYSARKADNHEYVISENHLAKLSETLNMIAQLKSVGWSIDNSDWYLERVLEFYRTGRVRGRCAAGKKTLHVTPNGYIKPCPDLPATTHYEEWISSRNADPIECDTCWYACRGEVEAPLSPSRVLYYYQLWKQGIERKRILSENVVDTHNGGNKSDFF